MMIEESKTSMTSDLHPLHATMVRGQLHVDGEHHSAPFDSLVQYAPPEPVSVVNTNAVKPRKGAVDTKKQQALSEVLSAMLPPRMFVGSDGAQYKQSVSLTPSSREQVIELQRQLDARLQSRQARESGICPVREELYSQCFDELIREVTIASPERGLLLLRVRDEMKLSLASYQCLFSSSMAFGLRKCSQGELGREDLLSKLAESERAKTEAQNICLQTKLLYDSVEKRILEQRSLEEKRMNEEKEFLKFQQTQLEAFLKANERSNSAGGGGGGANGV